MKAIEHRQGEINHFVNKYFSDRLNTSNVDLKTGPGNSLSADEVLRLAMKDLIFKALAEGNTDIAGFQHDISKMEYYIIKELCFHSGGDIDKTLEAARMTKLYDQAKKERGRSKWERSIPNHTFSKALQACKGVYYTDPKDDFEPIGPEDLTSRKSRTLFSFVDLPYVLNQANTPINWLIEKYLEAASMVVVFGDPESYKSFLAISWLLHIAAGVEWCGCKVRQTPALFIAGEGTRGLGRRIKAAAMAAGIDLADLPVAFSQQPAQLLDKVNAQLVREQIDVFSNNIGVPGVIFFDTLSRNFGPGNESATDDMARFVAALDEVVPPGCATVIVHHTGQNEKHRARGSIVLRAAADSEYRMSRLQQKSLSPVELSCTKMKDSQRPDLKIFQPEIITLEETNDYIIDSLHLRYTGGAESASLIVPDDIEVLSMLHEGATQRATSDKTGLSRRQITQVVKSGITGGLINKEGEKKNTTYRFTETGHNAFKEFKNAENDF